MFIERYPQNAARRGKYGRNLDKNPDGNGRMACVSRGPEWTRGPRADVDVGGELSDNLRDYVRKRAEDIWIFKTLFSRYTSS